MLSENFVIWCGIKLKESGKKELRDLDGIGKLWNDYLEEIKNK